MTREQKQHLRTVLRGKTARARAENRKTVTGPWLLMWEWQKMQPEREGKGQMKKIIILNVRLPCFNFTLL